MWKSLLAFGPPTIWLASDHICQLKSGLLGCYHDCHVLVVDAVISDRGLEEVGVLIEPVESVFMFGFIRAMIITI